MPTSLRARTDRSEPPAPAAARAPVALRLVISLTALLVFAGIAPQHAAGHARSVSYSSWQFTPDGARVQARVSLLELSRLGIPLPIGRGLSDAAASEAVGLYLADRLDLLVDGQPCPATSPVSHPTEDGSVSYRWSVQCDGSGPRTIRSSVLLEQAPSHLHFARLVVPNPDGSPARILERVLSEAEPGWVVAPDDEPGGPTRDPTGSSFGTYLLLGIEHILSGWDHLAFVFALVLLAGSLGEVARLVTGFTLAHSLTLALAVLRWVEPLGGPVEAMIGFSVALVALENGWLLAGRGFRLPMVATGALLVVAAISAAGYGSLPGLAAVGLALFTASHFGLLGVSTSPSLLRIVLAFAFGLVHGFGFAGVLAEMELPSSRLFPALLGFNLGVEIGQLAVVALLWPALVGLRRISDGRPYRLVVDIAGAAICGLGVFWFISRAFASGAG